MKIFLILCLLIISSFQNDEEEAFNIVICFYTKPNLNALIIQIIDLFKESNIMEILNLVLTNFNEVKGAIKECMNNRNI